MEVIVSTAYWGCIEWYYYITNADKVSIELFEFFPKQTYRNRCRIYAANGTLDLSIPLSERKNKSLTKDIRISYATNWQINHWRTIESAYSCSPFFEFYQDEIKPYYEKEYEFLVDFNNELHHCISDILKINNLLQPTDSYHKYSGDTKDFRNSIEPKIQSDLKYPAYIQVFSDKFGFIPNLSILDLIFNLGPQAKDYFREMQKVNYL